MTKIEQYKEAMKKIAEAREQAKNIAKDVFAEVSGTLFEKHPEMQSFSWTQYTPYFNDGDECIFSVRCDQECININRDVDSDSDDELDSYEIASSDYTYLNGKRVETPENKHPLFDAQKAVADFLSEFSEDDLREMFGDHAEITVTKSGVEVDSYDHD